MQKIKFNNGNEIDILGLGTYRLNSQKEVSKAIHTAYELDIRLIDTAEMYDNEQQIGNAIKELGINRQEMFITSKIWNSNAGYDKTLWAFEKSLKRLQTDYLDLYLIHWPASNSFIQTWKALEYLYKQGIAKNIGVSNFDSNDLQILFNKAEIKPVVNQIKLHPLYQQKNLKEFCRANDVAVQSWSPLMKGAVVTNSVLKSIGKKYGKTAVQVAVRWQIEQGIICIPKSANPQHIREFADVFDFSISPDDMKLISR